ncbi:MAG: hypothetical protein IT381_22150 [Deltaproteobacteria bacterium]|nr:hypothetical protein [Deltaproteobacteria bacterium]
MASVSPLDYVIRFIDAALTQPVSRPETASTPSRVDDIGYAGGLFVGEAVTLALSLVPPWNKPVVDARGAEVSAVPGAVRADAAHPILARHEQVVGPQITDFAKTLSHGFWHDLVDAFGRGASDAPGATYRLEVAADR